MSPVSRQDGTPLMLLYEHITLLTSPSFTHISKGYTYDSIISLSVTLNYIKKKSRLKHFQYQLIKLVKRLRVAYVSIVSMAIKLSTPQVFPEFEIIGSVVLSTSGHLEGSRVRIVVVVVARFIALHVLQAPNEVDGISTGNIRVLAGCLQCSSPSRIPH